MQNDEAVRRARRGLLIYFAALVPATAVIEALILAGGQRVGSQRTLVLALMWTPAVASLVARIALREGPGDVSFRPGQRKLWGYLVAWLFPVAVGLLAYGAGWASGLAQVSPPPTDSEFMASHPAIRFAVGLGIQLTVGTAVGCLSAAGEEIGWRGYMLTRLVDAKVPRPVLMSGLIWGLWHAPLIVSGLYASSGNAALSVAVFMVDVIAFGYLAGRLRLETGSVWPAVLIHASWNSVIQSAFDRYTASPGIWLGESGLLVAAVDVALVVLLVRGRWKVRRSPAEEPRELPALSM